MSNSLVIVMDEHINYSRLPKWLLKKLKGYNAFRKLGIEFTNIHCNRQQCTPSRSVLMSSSMQTGLQDDIDLTFQYTYVPRLSTELDTIAKVYKRNKPESITAYYGKNHIDSSLAITQFTTPKYCMNTRQAMKVYGYDIYSTFGDTFYGENLDLFLDNREFELKMPPNSSEYDLYDQKSKWCGILPFLKARDQDNRPFHAQFHIMSPHVTSQFWQNLEQQPDKQKGQFYTPFIDEQTNGNNPYTYNSEFRDAWVKHPNLTTNFFEETYEEYCNDYSSLPFLESYLQDYASDSKTNSLFPYYIAAQNSWTNTLTFAKDQQDIKSFKNLINNYYGLVIEADTYIYLIYKQLKRSGRLKDTSVIILSDHGDCLSAHGLKQKGFLYNEATNVCCLVYSPKLKERDIKCNMLGSLIDINKTIEVMAGLENKGDFAGSSLLKWVECGNTNVLVPNHHREYTNLHVVNGAMFQAFYFNFPKWYYNQTEDVKNRIVHKPKNLIDFLSSFVMIQTKRYKFVRYFNWSELILYNLKYRQAKLDFSLLQVKEFPDLSLELREKLVGIEDYESALDKIGSEEDSIFLYLLVAYVAEQLLEQLGGSLIFPGLYNSYSEIKDNPNYFFFCFDQKEDPNEIYNLADPLYPERHNLELFEDLNNKLNAKIIEDGLEEFNYFIPRQIFITSIILFLKFGTNLKEYEDKQIDLLVSMLTLNKMDIQPSINEVYQNLEPLLLV